MILYDAIENLQSNLNIKVKINQNIVFDGTVGELSTITVLLNKEVLYKPYFKINDNSYIVEIKK